MRSLASLKTRLAAVTTATALIVAAGATVLAPTAAADPGPIASRTASMVSADALPTVQIDGVAWDQEIVGNTVYVGGQFTNARPAGAAAGTNQTVRNNMLAYNLTTGALVTTFTPDLNAAVRAVTASPDGKRIYVGGNFTTANGANRYRIAAYDTATGLLVSSFAPKVDYTVNAIVATNSTVYVGGAFSTSGGQTRTRLAAYSATNGALLNWAPSANGTVQAMVISPDGTKVVIGGAFTTLTGIAAVGIGAVDATTGAVLPWSTNPTVRNGGANSAILALSTDGTAIYGGGYKYGSGGNLEGTFKMDANTGAVQWIEDCHGDTYGVYAAASALYQVGHAHYCGNDGGWPQPTVWTFNRTVAFTKDATGTLTRDPTAGLYSNFAGSPSPSIYQWFPKLEAGTFTGKSQAAWAVTGNANYVVLGGEFPSVNGTAQQGLVRFAVKTIAPNLQGPRLSGSQFKPTLTTTPAGAVKISFLENWDRDDTTLTYTITRTVLNGPTGSPIKTITADSTEWNRGALGYVDTTAAAGTTYTYRLQATDPSGNTVQGDAVSITAGASAALSGYGQTIVNQGAASYWPMNETTGSLVADKAGYNDAAVNATGVTLGEPGAISGDAAMTFDGSTGSLAASGSQAAPDVFTVEAMFKTTTTTGGRIIGFSDLQTETSGHRDRQIYMSNTGKLNFGVYGSTAVVISSPNAYNDGQWHQVAASLSPSGMSLYVDGVRVAQRSENTFGEKYIGYWRVGGDSLAGFANLPSSAYFKGSIDEVAIFSTALTGPQLNAQLTAAGATPTVPAAPADTYGATVYADEPVLYYRLGESSGTAAADSGPGQYPGSYVGTSTRGVAGAIAGTDNTAVTFNGTSSFVASNAYFVNPRVYSVEAWFKTTTTTGGKIIGFGNAKTGLSTTFDRNVYMQNDGKIVFGASSQATALVSANAYNNGQWHHVVGTQGASGLSLYIDGALVGSNGTTGVSNYTGYWRVGGDKTWNSTSSYFAGSIDDAAVYAGVLGADRVAAHYAAATGGTVNAAPTAAFTATPANLTASFDGSASTDSDGTIASYAWTFGDGATATGATASRTYAAAGTYQVTLTVTDNGGATNSITKSVTVAPAANVAPTAAFTSSAAGLVASVDGSGSTDSDGTIASYAWTFGDGATATGATASRTYAAGGTYQVTLTVTDNGGATNSITKSVTVAANNVAPTAAFTSSSTGLVASVNGSGSTDSDGTIASYAWTFGDGATATGATATRSYAAAGTYTVTLTVTDNKGATGTVSQPVTVSVGTTPAVLATDSFARTATNAWGVADLGGAWTVAGGSTGFAVSAGTGRITLPSASAQRTATLGTFSQSDVDVRFAVALDKPATGGNTQVSSSVRKVGNSEYRVNAIFNTAGAVSVQLVRIAAGVQTTLKSYTLPSYTYVVGDVINVRFMVAATATAGTSSLQAKAWKSTGTEPAGWQVSTTDSTAGLQAPGAVALFGYLASASTAGPVVVSFSGFSVQATA